MIKYGSLFILLLSGMAFGQVATKKAAGKGPSARYVFTDLGTLGGETSAALAINDFGDIVGWSNPAVDSGCLQQDGSPCEVAFLWQNGTMIDLGMIDANDEQSHARDINNHGDIAGVSGTSTVFGGTGFKGFVSEAGTMHQLSDLDSAVFGSTQAYGISQFGVVVGESATMLTGVGVGRAVTWTGGQMENHGETAPFDFQHMFGINSFNVIVGMAANLGVGWGNPRAVLFDGANWTILSEQTSSSQVSVAQQINDNNVVIGHSNFPTGPEHGAMWVGQGSSYGAAIDLGALEGYQATQTCAINNHDEIVGMAYGPLNGGDESRAVQFTDNGVVDLNSLLSRKLRRSVTLLEATDININGEIVGRALVNGNEHAFLLQPPAL